jgi:transposase-like protein
MGRPPCGLDEYLEWQQRLEGFKESGLSIDLFCLQEGVSRTTFYRWSKQLRDGIPESLSEEQAQRDRAETGEAVFLPITLKASPVEIELPNGGVVRLPLGVGQVVLVEVIRAVGALRPWKAPSHD